MASSSANRWRIATLRFSFGTVESLKSGALHFNQWVDVLSQHFESQLYSPVGLDEKYQAIRKSCRSKRELFVKIQADIVAQNNLKYLRQVNAIVPNQIWPSLTAIPWPLQQQLQGLEMSLLSDGHVHTNGATPLMTTLDVGFRAIHGRVLEGSWRSRPLFMRDTNSQRYDLMRVLELAFLLSATVQNLTSSAANSGRSTLMASRQNDADAFWECIARHAVGENEHGDPLVLEAMRDEMNEFVPPSVVDALSSLETKLSNPALEEYRRSLVDGMMICVGLLSHGLMSKTQAPLEDFVRSFSRQASARWNLLDPTGEDDSHYALESSRLIGSLQALSISGSIERLELRKSVHPSSNFALSVRDEIHRSLRVHLSGVASFLASRGSKMAFQMPLGLLKVPPSTSPQSQDTGCWTLRHDLMKYLHVLKEISSFVALNPSMEPFVGSIDVAGFETSVPNWIFALAFCYYAEACAAANTNPLRLTVHAGEHFDRPLEGLRAIWEATEFRGDVNRIGHGLALDHVLVSERDYAVSFNALGLLDDLLWSHDLIIHDALGSVWRGKIAPKIEDLARSIYGVQVSMADICQAREIRNGSDGNWDLGLDVFSNIGLNDDPVIWDSHSTKPVIAQSLAHGIALADLYEATITVESGPTLACDAELEVSSAAWLALSMELYPILREIVAQRLRDSPPIVIEVCPSSNVSIGGYEGYGELAISSWTTEGLRCSVNTDDPGLFGMTIHDEYAALLQSGALSQDEALQIVSLTKTATATGQRYDSFEDYESASMSLIL